VIAGNALQLQAQVSALGWRLDDLVYTVDVQEGKAARLAISAKGNVQVTSSGFPADFVSRAWEQWNKPEPEGPMNRSNDFLVLATLSEDPDFTATWREVTNACSGSDIALGLARIRANQKQSRVFDSVKKQTGGADASDEETVALIRRLMVIPFDFTLQYSRHEEGAVADCRGILESGDVAEAAHLWEFLLRRATEIRISVGTITFQELWKAVRTRFKLRNHPNFDRDWQTIAALTAEHKSSIETALPTGQTVPRQSEKERLTTEIQANEITIIDGESGSGKSSLLKEVLDEKFSDVTQVWMNPETCSSLLLATRRRALQVDHELSQVLLASRNSANVLVIDSAERVESAVHALLQNLIEALSKASGKPWKVIVVSQPNGISHVVSSLLVGGGVRFEMKSLESSQVQIALLESSTLAWLSGNAEAVSALTNLKTLAWVIQAGSTFVQGEPVSYISIADHLWKYWTGDRLEAKQLLMNLAQREASFERSFATTDLRPGEAQIINESRPTLPLHENSRNRIEFQHDLAADWGRFQYLKQIAHDTNQWADLAANPLWVNALRMLGQFLLRESSGGKTLWDQAFDTAEAADQTLVSDLLLDAICTDPEAERFLNERIDMLMANDAKHLDRLLQRFHFVATLPSHVVFQKESALNLYMEAEYRTVVMVRWPPVLRFLVAQKERISALVSTPLAKVIKTWLTSAPEKMRDGAPFPFRRDLAEIGLAMARSVQVEKGHGVWYMKGHSILYTAPLAGAPDIPDEVAQWALELCGRRDVSPDVSRRISAVRDQKRAEHLERLRTDPAYKARHEERKASISPAITGREPLPAWELGAQRKVDLDIHEACFAQSGLIPLMKVRPQLVSEILLALIIEDEPVREYGGSRFDPDLGIGFEQESHPTAFWKSPYMSFLQASPEEALGSLISLVNFCTERWAEMVRGSGRDTVPSISLQLPDGSLKSFDGARDVFGWSQENSFHNGNLFCALDALERWLILKLELGLDISPYVSRLLQEGKSAAFIGVLVNVAKFQPPLLLGPLFPLLTSVRPVILDHSRMQNSRYNFVPTSWIQTGEAIFEFAKGWVLAPHRTHEIHDDLVELVKTNDKISNQLIAMIDAMPLPEDAKDSLELRLFIAPLDRRNYRFETNPKTSDSELTYVVPDTLVKEAQAWNDSHAKVQTLLSIPGTCDQLLSSMAELNDVQAQGVFDLLEDCAPGASEDEEIAARCRIPLATVLIVLAHGWLERTAEAKELALAIVRAKIEEIPSTVDEIRSRGIRGAGDELSYVAFAATHQLIRNIDPVSEWWRAVLRIITCGDDAAAGTVFNIAFSYRDQLKDVWWRLTQVGVLWSGLHMLMPHHRHNDRAWLIWLKRLRAFSLDGSPQVAGDLRLRRIAKGVERLDFLLEQKEFERSEDKYFKPKRHRGMGLDSHYLERVFYWLIEGPGRGDWTKDVGFIVQLWDYDVARAKARKKDNNGEYDMPSQNLGYSLLKKMGGMTLTGPTGQARNVWEPVLKHGPPARIAVRHFFDSFLVRASKGVDPDRFVQVWREMATYALDADWIKDRYWYQGGTLLCSALGFGVEASLQGNQPGSALRLKDIYERWAKEHLGRDEDTTARFCHFLTSTYGSALILDGVIWIAAALKNPQYLAPSRKSTWDALVELLNIVVNIHSAKVISDRTFREAVLEVAAVLVRQGTPSALALQERIRLLK